MVLEECYKAFGGNYESVKMRISREEVIKKFLNKFLTEPSFDNLCESMEKEDYVEAFRAAHSLKGVSANLGFVRLEKSSSDLTEYLRNSSEKEIDKEKCKQTLEEVSKDYMEVMGAIRELDE